MLRGNQVVGALIAWLAGLVLSASPAVAQLEASFLTQQGRLFEVDGVPVQGEVTLHFTLYADDKGETTLWEETQKTAADDGYISVRLGAEKALDASIFDGSIRYLGMKVNDDPEEMAPLQALVAVPYAFRAGSVTGAVNATSLTVGGTTVIDSKGKLAASALSTALADGDIASGLSCDPGKIAIATASGWECGDDEDADTLGELLSSCTNGQVAKKVSGAWACGAGAGLVATGTPGNGAFAMFYGGGGDTLGESPVFESTGSVTIQPKLSGSFGVGQFRFVANAESPNFVGGHLVNAAGAAYGAVIAGGGSMALKNEVTDAFAVVGGGRGNRAGDNDGNETDRVCATVAGGEGNTASGKWSAIGGGSSNEAAGEAATVGGGDSNQALGTKSTVAGGAGASARGDYSTVAGGQGNGAAGEYSTIGGGQLNVAGQESPARDYVTIGGGKGNSALGDYSTISGGQGNQIPATGATHATIGGGQANKANGQESFVGGGYNNTASAMRATVVGGNDNTATGSNAAILGGYHNDASGSGATVTAGSYNIASGNRSVAGGVLATAGLMGCHVWNMPAPDGSGDATNGVALDCGEPSQWVARAGGGFYFFTDNTLTGPGSGPGYTAKIYAGPGDGSWTQTSDRNKKTAFERVDPKDALARVARLPITTWQYKEARSGARHMGPMAQDLWAEFHLGDGETHITDVDAHGVALAAIQGLDAIAKEQAAAMRVQATHLKQLRAENASLRTRLDRIEARIGSPTTQAGLVGWPPSGAALVTSGLCAVGLAIGRRSKERS